MAYPATPKTWVSGDVLTAAQLNAELRDALLAILPLGPPDAAWTAFTPTLTQSVTVTATNNYTRYTKIGRQVRYEGPLPVPGAGTAGQPVTVTMPPYTPAAPNNHMIGVCEIYDTSAVAGYRAFVSLRSSTPLHSPPTNGTVADVLGVTSFSAALAAGDVVDWSVTYE